MYISPFPTLCLKNLSRAERHFWPLKASNAYFYFRGANAIYHAVKSLQLGPEDNILVPAYHCGIEIEAVQEAGAKIKFYNIKETCEIDLEDMRQKIDVKTKGIFIIHYYGWPQAVKELKQLCEERHLLLIEDCAHALFSHLNGRRLGEFGDLSIFSLQKSLPVPDGGTLVINNSRFQTVMPDKKPRYLTTRRAMELLLLERQRMIGTWGYYFNDWVFVKPSRILLRLLKKLPLSAFKVTTSSSRDFSAEDASVGMSKVSSEILETIEESSVFEKRRENFQFLLEELKRIPGIRLLYIELPEGVCPLFLPILIPDRDRLQDQLKENGIGTFIFGKTLHPLLPKKQFPFAGLCSRQGLCLPVHQDLARTHLEYMVKTISELRHENTASH